MNSARHAYIETFGCQMNERDSEIMGQLLARAEYITTTELPEAEVVVINTCSVRAKAEQKAFSLLGRLRKLKRLNPELVIAVTGCVAQQEGEKLRERMPHVDLVVGPQQIYRLADMVAEVRKHRQRGIIATELSSSFEIPAFLPSLDNSAPHKRFVTIMQGCNNFCTYCVVPFTRGREISRPFEDVLAEVEHLIRLGVKEVTLLGQNVNSYGLDCKHGERRTFPELLRVVAGIKGLVRLRFTTSHPKDLSEELMRCFGELDNLCPHFHLPVQSGSNRILKRMNRRYTIESYLEKVEALRRYRPEILLTTDLIVGFPGETDKDFAATMELLETVRYHGAFSFKYSDRPYAKSIAFSDKVAEEVKQERLALLQARQEEIALARRQEYVGQEIEVMVEGESRTAAGQWSGTFRT
ncbi:MAG: tRNA (N6-isopentenyl adenosine(37)-C2)-methylthiotransferase MiaB [Deltaproteobacteria bacterium]